MTPADEPKAVPLSQVDLYGRSIPRMSGLTEQDFPWNGSRRCDGVLVVELLPDMYAVVQPNPRSVLTLCPCCDGRLGSQAAARFVADKYFPLTHSLEK